MCVKPSISPLPLAGGESHRCTAPFAVFPAPDAGRRDSGRTGPVHPATSAPSATTSRAFKTLSHKGGYGELGMIGGG